METVQIDVPTVRAAGHSERVEMRLFPGSKQAAIRHHWSHNPRRLHRGRLTETHQVDCSTGEPQRGASADVSGSFPSGWGIGDQLLGEIESTSPPL